MFKWLAKQFTAPDQDPDSLGSDLGLRNFIAALPVTVPARTLEAIGEQFEHARSLEIPPDRLRHALKTLDERAQEPLGALADGLIGGERGRELSDPAWLALSRYYRNLYVGYRVCLDALNNDPQRENVHADAVLITCRSTAALARYKTLLRMRYRDVDAGYWENLFGLVAWTTSLGATHTLVELYPRCGFQSSVERELLLALMLDAAPIPNLLPPQIAALEILLRRFAGSYQFSDTPREGTPFVVEPGASPVVRRWIKGLKARPHARFFGAATAYGKIAGLQKEFRQSGTLPDWLGNVCIEPPSYGGLLELLLSHWSVEPPQRRQRRDRAEGEILITRGVAQVRRMIAASEYAKAGGRLNYEDNTPYDHKLFGRVRFGSVDATMETLARAAGPAPSVSPMETLQKFELEGDRQMTERWSISDVSASGLGATATAHGGWGRVGMLIGYRRMDSLDWQMAVVRRLSRSAQGRLSIGMQTLGEAGTCARIRIGAGDGGNAWVAVAGTTDVHHDAILVRSAAATFVLLERGTFTGELDCMISFDRRWHAARLLRVTETGYDYERVEITLLQAGRRDASAADTLGTPLRQ
jgi:hypothetical protein